MIPLSFRILSSSAGIPSPPLISNFAMAGSGWRITPSYLSGLFTCTSHIPINFSSLKPKMLRFTLALSCWLHPTYLDSCTSDSRFLYGAILYSVRSLHWSPDTSLVELHFCFGPATLWLLESLLLPGEEAVATSGAGPATEICCVVPGLKDLVLAQETGPRVQLSISKVWAAC